MANNSDAQKLIYDISEIFYRNGKYGLERIAIICTMIKNLLFVINKHEFNIFSGLDKEEVLSNINEIFRSTDLDLEHYLQKKDIEYLCVCLAELIKEDKNDIADAIQKLIDNGQKSAGVIPTDWFSVKIMQAFAKKVYKEGTYIDPCVGTGRLLAGLDAEKFYGFDIDKKALNIAETYVSLIENHEKKQKIDVKFSTENFLYKDLSFSYDFVLPTYILDPPLNMLLETPDNTLAQAIKDYVYPSKGKLPSEYLFLSKILFNDRTKNLSYVTTFSNSFSTTQDIFKKSFRRFLIDDNLIAVIQSNFSDFNGINKLILVGDTRKSHSQYIYLITPKTSNIPEDVLNDIAQTCVAGKTISESDFYKYAKIKMTSVEELADDDYQIYMPQYFESEISQKHIASIDEIVQDIKTTQDKMVETFENFSIFINNLNNGIKNIQEDVNDLTKYASKTEEKPKNWFDEIPSDLNTALGIFGNEKEVDWTPIDFEKTHHITFDYVDSCLMHLRELFKANRLRINNNKLEIYSLERLSEHKNDEIFSYYIIENNKKDNFISYMYENLSQTQKNIFEAFIKLHFDEVNIFDNFTTSEIHSAISTLITLGLLFKLKNVDNELEKYIPYIPILNIQEDY